MLDMTCTDPVIVNQWHPLSSLEEINKGIVHTTQLLANPVSYGLDIDGTLAAWISNTELKPGSPFHATSLKEPLPVKNGHGYLWTCLGEPPKPLFSFDEFYAAVTQYGTGTAIGDDTSHAIRQPGLGIPPKGALRLWEAHSA